MDMLTEIVDAYIVHIVGDSKTPVVCPHVVRGMAMT